MSQLVLWVGITAHCVARWMIYSRSARRCPRRPWASSTIWAGAPRRFPPELAIPAGRRCDESKIWHTADSGSHTKGPCCLRDELHDPVPSITQPGGGNDMDQNGHNTTSHCPVYGGSRWWRSRTGARVCQRCHPDALAALQVLADQLKTAPPSGERCGGAAIDKLSE
jgi:hypothetical protein